MKRTALYKIHEQLGAKFTEFAGYQMPVEYPAGVIQEHKQVRKGIGLFDVSHMGEIFVRGPKAMQYLQKISSNDASLLSPGEIQYTCLVTKSAGIVDDLLLYRIEENEFLLVVNASNDEKDWKWLNEQNTEGAELEHASQNISQLAAQGPKTAEALQSLTTTDLNKLQFNHFIYTSFAGVPDVLISATGYTGSGGFELYFPNEHAQKIWNSIMEAGKPFDILPVGLSARDTLRLEKGLCLYGNDMNETTTPIEAGLSWVVKIKPDKNLNGKDILSRQKEEKPKRRLKGFQMLERGIPRHGYDIFDSDSNVIGQVTSGTMSPMLNTGIGMGYIAREYAKKDTIIYIGVRKKRLQAKIVKMPFV